MLFEKNNSYCVSETEKSETKVGKNKHQIINSLKNNPSLTKELRAVLEQSLTEKLESLGIKSVRSLYSLLKAGGTDSFPSPLVSQDSSHVTGLWT